MTFLDSARTGPSDLTRVVVHLCKGPLYRDQDGDLWEMLRGLRGRVADHVAVLGLRVEIDEAEGYAFLRPDPDLDDDTPRLIPRRMLPFTASVLLVQLRKRLQEFDSSSSEARLILTRDHIVAMLSPFLPATTNETRTVNQIETAITKVVELGYLQRLRGETDRFEVRRIIKAFVDAAWLAKFDELLAGARPDTSGDEL